MRGSRLTDEEYESLTGPLERENERKSQLVQKIQQWIQTCPAAQHLQNICRENLLAAYFFGGVCRDCWNSQEPRDIDVVVDDGFWETFLKKLGNIPTRTNRFGGLKLTLHGMNVDLWMASNTWAFQHSGTNLRSPTVLPETTFLNIESVVALIWHPEEPWVFQKGFFRAMESQTLEIQNPENPSPALCIARARRFLASGNWKKGESLTHFETYHKSLGLTETDIQTASQKHYGR